MRKQTTFLAVLSTAVFTASMAFPAYAKAAGWTEENGNWYYYDSYGDPLTDTWKKSGNDWYYLNADGVRAYSEQIDEYYVNEEGKRVTYQWVTMDNEDYWSEDDAPEFLHYYYGKDGKALTSTWASIDGNWYYFNEDSIMETGSIQVDGYNYYLGEDGSRKTGWVLLEEETDDPEDLNAWYYFDSNGRRIENEIDKKIDGSYYTFEEGKMHQHILQSDGNAHLQDGHKAVFEKAHMRKGECKGQTPLPDDHKGNEHAEGLGRYGGDGGALGPHPQSGHQEQVPCDVEQAGHRHGEQRRSGIPQSPENSSQYIVENDEHHAYAAHLDIILGGTKGLLGCMDQAGEHFAAGHHDRGAHNGHQSKEHNAGAHTPGGLLLFPGPHAPGHKHRHTHGQSHHQHGGSVEQLTP